MKKIVFTFPIEKDCLTGELFYPNWLPVSVNRMYTSSPSWKKLTKEAKLYKSYIWEEIDKQVFDKIYSENIFYTWFFQFNIPSKKDGSINLNYKFDLDNMLKAFQDSMSWRIFKDDKNVKWFLILDEYFSDSDKPTKIELNIFENFTKDKFINLSAFIKKQFKEKKDKTSYSNIFKFLFKDKEIQPISINSMYANGSFAHKKWRKWKRLTKEAIVYKNYLKNEISNQYSWELLKKNIFYIVKFNFVVPKTTKWDINKAYIKDLDNMLKAFQDCMSNLIFNDDIQVRWILAFEEYNTEGITSIDLELFEFDWFDLNFLLKSDDLVWLSNN